MCRRHWNIVEVAFILCASISAWYSAKFSAFAITSNIDTFPIPSHKDAQSRFTFEGEDIPRTLYVDKNLVRMSVEESIRYEQANPEGIHEWRYSTLPLGSGVIVFEPSHRALFVNMFHQLHCVEYLDRNLVVVHEDEWGHIQHCLNYLRTMSMCRPDLTLEPGDFSTRNFTVQRMGAEHVCHDWIPAFDRATESYFAWTRFRSSLTNRGR